MNVKINEYTQPPEWWDKEVAANQGYLSSSSQWETFHKRINLGKAIYIEVLENDQRALLIFMIETLIGGALMLSLPKLIVKLLMKLSFLRTYSFHLQPTIINKTLLSDEEKLSHLSIAALEHIVDRASKNGVNIGPTDFICFKSMESVQKLKHHFGETASLIGTTKLMFTTTSEKLYKKMNESVKSGIRKCEKLGVSIEQLYGDISPFFNGLEAGWKQYHLAVNPKEYYQQLYETSPEQVKYFVAKYQGEIVAGSGVLLNGGTMMEFSMYVTPYGKEHKIPGGDLLKWEIIKYGITHGYQFLDLNMIAVTDHGELDEKIKNINFYKLKWGGEVVYGVKLNKLHPFLKSIQKIKQQLIGI